MRQTVQRKLDKLAVAKSSDDSELWQDSEDRSGGVSGGPQGKRPGSQDNILQVLADDGKQLSLIMRGGEIIRDTLGNRHT